MERWKGKNKISVYLSLVLAVILFVGSLPLMEFETKAAAAQSEKGNQKEAKAQGSRFQHPGMMHSAQDLAKAWENVNGNVSPNKETWDALWGDTYSNPNWNPRPVEEVTRGVDHANIGQFCVDLKRAYQNALIWKLSGDKAHGDTACRIVNAWSSTLKRLGGSQDRFLVSGIQGYQLANIGELLRGHPDFDLKGLQNVLLTAFYPLNQDFLIRHNDTYVGSYWANWELANIASMISIGVFCDREDIYEQALDFFKNGKGNGSFYHAMPYVLEQNGEELVQWQESVRDQGHTTLGLLLAGVICETAWNQGDDLYGLSDNRFMKAAEYAIKYNSLNEDVPSTWYMRVGGNLRGKPTYEFFAGINPWPRGSWRPIYYQMYNHYLGRRGVDMPNAQRMIEQAEGTYIEGAPGDVTDQLGWYSLTYAKTGERVEDKPIQGELTDGVYRIVSELSGKSLVTNVAGELVSTEKGSSSDEWWLIKNNGDGEYTITSMSTGKAVQINGEGTEVRNVDGTDYTYSKYYLEGPAVGTGQADGSRKQHFAFLRDDDGLFRIVPSMTYYVWGLAGDDAGDGVNVIQWFNNAQGAYNNDSTPGQRWRFEKATEVGTEFTFDDESTGFHTAYASAEGSYTLAPHGNGKAVSLNGTSDFLSLSAKTGKSVLAGETAFTVSCEINPDEGSDNWLFYASPKGAQQSGKETYLGIKETNGTVTATAYKNGVQSASVSVAGKDGWYHLSAAYDGAEIILYINGREKARKTGNISVSEIVGIDGSVQIGKSDLEGGRYYKGLIDNLNITGHVMTEGEVIKEAGDYALTEIKVPEVLADFTFDDEQEGFAGGAAVAKGVYSLANHGTGKALYLNGDKDYLKVTGAGGGSVVPGGLVEEMTVSLQAKRDGGEFGWVFYAAQDDNSPTFGWEKYLGVIDGDGTFTAQRYFNQGLRPEESQVEAETKADSWHYLTVVFAKDKTILYEDGQKKAEAAGNASLSDILGSDSIWYIGKANWKKAFNREKGEHFRGWIDNFKVVSRAWTDAEVKTEALKYVDKSILQETVDNQKAEDENIYEAGRWAEYQSALETANQTLKDAQALQPAIDSAEAALSKVQAWMRMDEALHAAVAESQEALYTEKSWEPYRAALNEAKTLNENKEAAKSELLEVAKKLRESQSALVKKDETISEAVRSIESIGVVELTPECSRKVILARQVCSRLTEEELKSVANLSQLETAEAAMADYLAEFTFDDEESGLIGGQAMAEGAAPLKIKDGALYLDGSSANWLNVTKGDGSSLLTGRTELTISFAVKPESGNSNWLFYAAPDQNAQELNYEKYLGLLEYEGAFTAERYKNDGERPAAASVENVDVSRWMYVTLVHTAEETALYINGEKKASQVSSLALSDILGENSILQIGKANWGNGEYFKGYLDNFKILGTAITEQEIKAQANGYLDKAVNSECVEDVIAKINAIGKVTVNIETKEKIDQARAFYDKLSSAEKNLITNADILFAAESLYGELAEEAENVLGEFTFDDTETGFVSSNAVARPSGTPAIIEDAERGKVLSLDGSGSVWLDVKKPDGTPLLTDVEEMTVSYYSKAGRSDTNWAFYAAPHGKEQILGQESYVGVMENGAKVTAERYLNGRQDSPEAEYEAGWNQFIVVFGASGTKIYVNGVLKGTTDNKGALKEILGNESILQIGKANWGSGEYYQGLLDDFAVYNYAFSERQVQIQAGLIANPKEIKDKIREASLIPQGNYSKESFAALQEAIAAAKKAYGIVTTKGEVAAAVSALQEALDGLVDCTELLEKIDEAKAIERGNYTGESYAALQEAIQEAERALSGIKSRDDLSQAVEGLQSAINALQTELDKPVDDVILVKELKISPKTKKLTVGGQFTLQVTVSPQNATNQEYEIYSSNPDVAAVSGMKVIAKKAGKAVISALARDNSGAKGFIVVEVCQKKTTKVNAVQQKTSKNVKVTFAKVSGASGYNIYRSVSLKKGYKKIGSAKKTSYVDKKVKTSKTYYYKVVAKARDSKYNSALSTVYAKVKVLACPTVKVKALKGRKAKVSWKKVKGAKGYIVYTSTKKKKGFKAVKVLKKAKAIKTTVKVKKSAKKLYIKVRPYYNVKGKKVYGPYSKTKTVKVKK